MAHAIPPEEYQRWYPPRAAIERLRPVSSPSVIAALESGIRNGSIRAAAQRVFHRLPGQRPRQVATYALQKAGDWIDQAEQQFWDLGSITIRPPKRSERISMGSVQERGTGPDVELVGVRLDRTGIDNLAAQLGHSLPSTPDTEVASLKAKILELERALAAREQPAALASSAELPATEALVQLIRKGSAAADFTEEEFAKLTERLKRRRGEGPYEPWPEGVTEQRARELVGSLAPKGAQPENTNVAQGPADAMRKRANPMTDREIKAWYRGLTRTQKTLGVLALWQLAKDHNPGRHLPRKLVEQFGTGRTTGHRAKK